MEEEDEDQAQPLVHGASSCRLTGKGTSRTGFVIPLQYLVGAACFCVSLDQNLMAPTLSAIAHGLGLNDRERDQKLGGEISVAFFIVGGVISLAIGVLADRWNRRDLLVGVSAAGGLASLGSAMSYTYSQLFWSRTLAGVAVGGLYPLTYSLLGDLYPPAQRTKVNGYIGITMGIGVGAGQNMAAVLGTRFGWRSPFLAAALPALLTALVTWFCTTEPLRGRMDEAYQRRFDGLALEDEEEAEREGAEAAERGLSVCVDDTRQGAGAYWDQDSDHNQNQNQGLEGTQGRHRARHRYDEEGEEHKQGRAEQEREEGDDPDEEKGLEEQDDRLRLGAPSDFRPRKRSRSREGDSKRNRGASGVEGRERGEKREEARWGEDEEWRGDEEMKHVDTVRELTFLWRTRSALLIYLQGVPGCVPWGQLHTHSCFPSPFLPFSFLPLSYLDLVPHSHRSIHTYTPLHGSNLTPLAIRCMTLRDPRFLRPCRYHRHLPHGLPGAGQRPGCHRGHCGLERLRPRLAGRSDGRGLRRPAPPRPQTLAAATFHGRRCAGRRPLFLDLGESSTHRLSRGQTHCLYSGGDPHGGGGLLDGAERESGAAEHHEVFGARHLFLHLQSHG